MQSTVDTQASKPFSSLLPGQLSVFLFCLLLPLFIFLLLLRALFFSCADVGAAAAELHPGVMLVLLSFVLLLYFRLLLSACVLV